MTRIDFYAGATEKASVACRLAAKAIQQSNRVLIFAPDERLLKQVDQLLWTTPPTGFVPHCWVHDAVAADTPVLLAAQLDNTPHDEILINLGNELPAAFTRFARVLEIVTADEDDRAQARTRFRFYRDRGYALETHQLSDSSR